MKTNHTGPHPHEGGCAGCYAANLCNVCGGPRVSGCTNGRCHVCHRDYCTPGGDVYPGHGYGDIYLRSIRGTK